MCFTISIKLTRDALERRFKADASALDDFEFRYFYRAFDNPMIPVITQEDPNKIELMQWGLIPHWTNDMGQAEKIRQGTYNARGETIDEKPSFSSAFKQSRCWVLINGFFEWQHLAKDKIPWYIHQKDKRPFALAGVYDTWDNPESGRELRTFSIVTTKANQLMENIHNTKKRMPVVLDKDKEKLWITRGNALDHHKLLLKPAEEQLLSAHTIRKMISKRDADPHDEQVIAPYDYHKNNTLF